MEKEKPTTQDQPEQQETPKQTVPAPIPEKSAWKVEITEKVTETVEIAGGKYKHLKLFDIHAGNYLDWPAPKEAVVETNDSDKEKAAVAPKIKNKGQWKPFTPTIVHASSKSSRSNRKIRRSTKTDKDAPKKAIRKGSKSSTTSTKEPTTEKADDKKPKSRTVRPKSTFRRKTPAYVNVDADTLKVYIMQQM
jgi:la-related protein 1